MTKFKVGDRVKYISGEKGTILSLTSSYLPDTLLVQWDLTRRSTACHEKYLTIVEDALSEYYSGVSSTVRGPRDMDEKKCTCPIHDLMNNGCTCQGFKAETERKKKENT
jgi:hypothetical protein